MSTTTKIFLWLLIFGLVILLDWVMVVIWRVYRRLKAECQNSGVEVNRWRLLQRAFVAVFSLENFSDSRKRSTPGVDPWLVGSGGHSWNRKATIKALFRWPLVNLLMAIGAMYAGQYLMVHNPSARYWGLAAIVGGLALAYFRNRAADPASFAWTDVFQVSLGFLIQIPLALNPGNWMNEIPAVQLIVIWLLSVVLVAIPALKLGSTPICSGWQKTEPLDKRDWVIIALLILGAFLLRIVALDTLPLPIDPDEASLGLYFKDVAEGRYKSPFGTGWATHPALQWFFLVPLTYLFKNPVFLMRFPSVIYGTLAVGGLYLVARIGFGKRTALLAGVLMMTSDVQIHFSRLGVNNISDSLFATWTMAGLWAAASTGHPIAYLLTGAGMGLAQYYYFGNRALPFVVSFSLLLWVFLDWRQFRRSWKLLLYLFLVFLVVAGPLLGLMVRQPEALDRIVRVATFFTKTWETQSQDTGEPLGQIRWHQVRDSFLVFTVEPDRGTFYKPGRAMLSSFLAPFFFVGLFILFANLRQPSRLSLLAWISVFLTLGSILINTAATFQRLLGMYPAVILVTAAGLDAGASALSRVLPFNTKTLTNRLSAVLVVVAAIANLYFYFWTFNTQVVWKPPDYEAAAIAVHEYHQFQAQGTFVLDTRLGVGEDGTIYLPLFKLAGKDFIGSLSQVNPQIATRPLYFYLFHDKLDDLPAIKADFPGGEAQVYLRQADGELIMVRYTVP